MITYLPPTSIKMRLKREHKKVVITNILLGSYFSRLKPKT